MFKHGNSPRTTRGGSCNLPLQTQGGNVDVEFLEVPDTIRVEAAAPEMIIDWAWAERKWRQLISPHGNLRSFKSYSYFVPERKGF